MKPDLAKMVARLDSILNPPSSLGPPSPRRHKRKCAICRHPERQAIEQDFLQGRPIEEIVEICRVNDRSTIYRHANAQGLGSGAGTISGLPSIPSSNSRQRPRHLSLHCERHSHVCADE
jgi:hypothetical protein